VFSIPILAFTMSDPSVHVRPVSGASLPTTGGLIAPSPADFEIMGPEGMVATGVFGKVEHVQLSPSALA
jgi:hypothetical protein